MGFEISMDSREWSDYIDLPVDETKQNQVIKLLELADDMQFKIRSCKEIPELNGEAFAEDADFAELNFLAKRVEEICKDQTQICAYRALISELPDNICEAINHTYGLETIPVCPCENVEEYGEIVLDNDFLEELDEIPYEVLNIVEQLCYKIGAYI